MQGGNKPDWFKSVQPAPTSPHTLTANEKAASWATSSHPLLSSPPPTHTRIPAYVHSFETYAFPIVLL